MVRSTASGAAKTAPRETRIDDSARTKVKAK
jgi:hypothetical protein